MRPTAKDVSRETFSGPPGPARQSTRSVEPLLRLLPPSIATRSGEVDRRVFAPRRRGSLNGVRTNPPNLTRPARFT